jgi:hypothetical protein
MVLATAGTLRRPMLTPTTAQPGSSVVVDVIA